MLNFRPIQLGDKEQFESYMKLYDTITCHYSFHSLYAWKDYLDVQIAFYNDALYIKLSMEPYDSPLFYLPICEDNILFHLNNLKEYCSDNNYKFILTYLEEHMKVKLLDIFNEFRFAAISNNNDYIYLKDNLKHLSGKKLKNKRNFVNQFKKNYESRYSYEHFSSDLVSDIIRFIDNFNNDLDDTESLSYEREATKLLLNNHKELNIFGGILRIDNEIVAFCLSSYHPSSSNTVVVNIERSNHKYVGASQMINYLFANHLSSDIVYINREEDFGIGGLRKAKRSYNPILNLGTSYNAYHNSLFSISKATDNNLEDIKQLYYDNFKNDEFSDYFFKNIYNVNNTHLTLFNPLIDEHKVISMVTKMSLTLNTCKEISYLFALATKFNFRNQGIMKNLIESMDVKDVILIPEDDQLLNFYNHLGFKMRKRGYKNMFHPCSIKENPDIKELSYKDINIIDELYNEINEINVKRDDIYPYIFKFYKVYGYFENKKLIAYAFLDLENMYVSETVSSDIDNIRILTDFFIHEFNLEKIEAFNSFLGKELYYFYKGDVDPKLFVNTLYE